MKVIVVGGGWAGCSAAIAARKGGAEVDIYERTDMLLGVGNVGGIMRNNGRFTAAEELIAMGAGELISITDNNAIHKNIDFPQHKHAWLCNVGKLEPEVRKLLMSMGINIHFEKRAQDVEVNGDKIVYVKFSDKTKVEGDVFIEATGSTGSMDNCFKYGNGCVMCTLRCPTFGMRISLSSKAGIKDIVGQRDDGTPGAMSGSCEISRDSLSNDLLMELEEKGFVSIKIPEEDVNLDKLKSKVCQQYALKEFAENIILLDTGHIKVMTSYYPIEKLRKLPGLEQAKYIDPYSGGKGNSIRYLSSTPRTNEMRCLGIENLFVAGEKSGFFVGHTEAMCTGTLSGYNAVRYLLGESLLVLPRETAFGDILAFANEVLLRNNGSATRLTFSGAEYFDRMRSLGLYTIDIDEIMRKIDKLGLTGVFNSCN